MYFEPLRRTSNLHHSYTFAIFTLTNGKQIITTLPQQLIRKYENILQ